MASISKYTIIWITFILTSILIFDRELAVHTLAYNTSKAIKVKTIPPPNMILLLQLYRENKSLDWTPWINELCKWKIISF